MLLFLKQVSFCTPGWPASIGMVLQAWATTLKTARIILQLSKALTFRKNHQSPLLHYTPMFETYLNRMGYFGQMRFTYAFSVTSEVIQRKWKPIIYTISCNVPWLKAFLVPSIRLSLTWEFLNISNHMNQENDVWYSQCNFKRVKPAFYMYQNWKCLYWFLKSGLVCYRRARHWLYQMKEHWLCWFQKL